MSLEVSRWTRVSVSESDIGIKNRLDRFESDFFPVRDVLTLRLTELELEDRRLPPDFFGSVTSSGCFGLGLRRLEDGFESLCKNKK